MWTLATGKITTAYPSSYQKWLRAEFSPDSYNPQLILTCYNKNDRKYVQCCNAADSSTLHCTRGVRLQAATWGSELIADFRCYAGSSHHQGENENTASGGALADTRLHLWQPMDSTAVSTVSSEQEFLIFHQLGSLFRVTDRQAQAVTLKYLKIFGCEPL